MGHGKLDGFVTDRLVGGYQIKAANKPFRPAGKLLYRKRMGIPVTHEHQALLEKITQALFNLERSSFMAGLQDKWFGPAALLRRAKCGGRHVRENHCRQAGPRFRSDDLRPFFSPDSMGFALAVPAGVTLNGRASPLRLIVRTVVDFVRGTPVLIQLFFVYFEKTSRSASTCPR